MKKNSAITWSLLGLILLFSCKSKDTEKSSGPKTYDFTISGQIKGIGDQKIYLEELSFSSNDPVKLDSTTIKSGSFNLSGKATEEGLYRVLTQDGGSFIFVNDENKLELKADDAAMRDLSSPKMIAMTNSSINSPANQFMRKVVLELEKRSGELNIIAEALNDPKVTGNDSLYKAQEKLLNNKVEDYNNYLIGQFNATNDPIVATMILGNTSFPDPASIKQYVEALSKRFPNHKGIAKMVKAYQDANAVNNQSSESSSNIAIGKPAPDFTLNDVNGKAFSLSSLKGQYVLVDFWASWCGPCRGENPNVVAAYNKLKNKNFTVLGVSLDEDKSAWLKAIKDDGLNWKHVSDLKGWQSMVVGLYGFNGIPFNVLVDPQGNVVGKELRGEDLDAQISKLMK